MIYELQLVIVNLNFPDPILQYYTVRTKGGPVVLCNRRTGFDF